MKNENLQPQFSGFFNTPHLFLSPINGLHPFLKALNESPIFKQEITKTIRLGQRVERFVSEELRQHDSITILSENPQIKNDKLTIGELDCLFLDGKQPVHLEIQFKYYLYDPSLGTTELDHCIGPMRKDTLNEKLNKLKTKQLPLLYSAETKPLLDGLNYKAEDFVQQIYFKAQIFVPFEKSYVLETLNPRCVYGFYFKYKSLPFFKEYKFYKPKKTDWLLDLSPNVDWQTYDAILPELKIYESEGYSPMLWLKHPKGHLDKCFVVAW